MPAYSPTLGDQSFPVEDIIYEGSQPVLLHCDWRILQHHPESIPSSNTIIPSNTILPRSDVHSRSIASSPTRYISGIRIGILKKFC